MGGREWRERSAISSLLFSPGGSLSGLTSYPFPISLWNDGWEGEEGKGTGGAFSMAERRVREKGERESERMEKERVSLERWMGGRGRERKEGERDEREGGASGER